jgi:hypothetical protein
MTNKIGDFDTIISDRNLFNQVVYTSLPDAVRLLKERQKDKELIKKVEELLDGDIPESLKKMDLYAVNEEQIATPNYDTKRFVNLANEFCLKPVFSEYYDDKFSSNNAFKHSLGVIHLENGIYKNGESKLENITIVDFNKYNGKPIRDVQTLWSESLVDFHHRLFDVSGIKKENLIFHDDSSWLKRNGGKAEKYYEKEILLYICHGILFQNFLLNKNESDFTKNIFLPALQNAINLTGLKPLIVPLTDIQNEEDLLWYFYDIKIKKHIKLK